MSGFNPDMLTLARETRSVSQTELARRIGRTPGYVNKVEHGFIEPTQAQIAAFGRELCYPVSFFESHEPGFVYDSPCLYHRKRKTLPQRLLQRVEARMHALRLHVRWLTRDLEIEPLFSLHTMDSDEFGGPEKVAQALRRAWGLPRGPIPNLTHLVEAAGAVVLLDDFGTTKLDGLSCWEKAGPPLFYLNSAIPTDILRFTLAHELGHLVMHAHPTLDPEGEADAFAAEFLMPASEIRSHLQNLQFAKLGVLKQYWRVSMKNLITRASRLGVVTESRSRSLYVQLSEKGYIASAEPYPLDPEIPQTVAQALAVHLERHKYTVPQLIALTRMDEKDWMRTFGPSLPEKRRRRLASVGT